MDPLEEPPARVTALSLPARIVVAVMVGVVTVAAAYHLAMVFLHVAPSNTLSKEHATAVSDYVYPEFEQNWKLFAPDPLQQNIHVEARAEVRKPDGSTQTGGWVDLTGQNVASMRHNPLPSHTQQNELRRAWSYYSDNHQAAQEQADGAPGDLSSIYLLRIVERRFGSHTDGGVLTRVQIRTGTTPVAQPPWISGTPTAASTPSYRQLPWWNVDTAAQEQKKAS